MRLLGPPVLAAALAALIVSPTWADCSAEDPACLPQPPDSVEVNPEPATGDGAFGQVSSPGLLTPLEAVIPMHLHAVEVVPLAGDTSAGASAPVFTGLDVPMRYQDPGDVSCGIQALGMALDGLGGGAPESSAMLGFLQSKGMMYYFGTGVEELAYAAQSFGYKGSYSFHDGTLADLRAQLAEGRPVTVALGTNAKTPRGTS